MRLFASAIVCFFMGSFVLAGVQKVSQTGLLQAVSGLTAVSVLSLLATLWLLNSGSGVNDGLKRALIIIAPLYVGLALGAWAAKLAGPIKPSVLQIIISALSLQGAILLLIIPFLREHQTTWAEAFGLRRRWPMALLMGLLLASAFTPLAWKLQEVSAWFMTKLNLTPKLQEIVQTLESDRGSVGRVTFGLVSVLIVPVAEEAFFRGILYSWVRSLGYRRTALVATSVFFALMHWNMVGFIPLTLLAMGLAGLYEATGNLLAPITAHALFNAANLFRFYYLQHAVSP